MPSATILLAPCTALAGKRGTAPCNPAVRARPSTRRRATTCSEHQPGAVESNKSLRPRAAKLVALAGATFVDCLAQASTARAALGPKGQALVEQIESGGGLDLDTDKLIITATAAGALGLMVFQAYDYKTNVVDKSAGKSKEVAEAPAPAEEAAKEEGDAASDEK
mmetsp:Transcript_1513/g.5202  ORF Transcript_1513/g.5202 Transcript_1513/m.5202 type:complete len:165 (-) Transcript_1513:1061-1555(-)